MTKFQKIIFLLLLLFTLFSRYYTVKHILAGLSSGQFVGRDAGHYIDIASNLLQRKIYALGEYPTAIRPPGYPYFLLLNFYLFGKDNFFPIIVEQITMTVLTALLIFSLAKFFSPVCGLLATGFYAFWYPLWERPAWISTEVFAQFLLTLAVYLIIFSLRHNKIIFTICSGIITSLAALTRSELLIIPIAVMLFLLIKYRNKLVYYLLGVFLILLPWIVRNYIVYHKFVFTTSSGILLFSDQGAHRVEALGDSSMFFGIQNPELLRLRSAFDIAFTDQEIYYNEQFSQEKLSYAVHHPGKVFRVVLKNFLIMLYPMGPMAWKDRYDPFYGLLMFLIVYLIVIRRQLEDSVRSNILLLNIVWISILVPTALFAADPIYRSAFEPLLCVIGSYGMEQFFTGNRRRWLFLLLIVGVNLVLHFVYAGLLRISFINFLSGIFSLKPQ